MGLPVSKAETKAIFDAIYRRYDVTNSVLSLGLHRYWRREACRPADVQGGGLFLDLATGTGACVREILRSNGADVRVVGLDASQKMLEMGGKVWKESPGLMLVLGEMEHLPFRDGVFDHIAVGFGIRNSWDEEAALKGALRVARPGARLVILEFSEPPWPVIRQVYRFFLTRVVPLVGGWITREEESYRYLGRTIIGFGSPAELRDRMRWCGWREVTYRLLTGGIVAVHRGRRGVGT